MPLLDGGDRSSGTAISVNGREHIVIKNFQITRYEIGVYASSAQFITIDNIIIAHMGDIADPYSGRGIAVGSNGNDNAITNCVVYNSAAEGISVVGDRNLVSHCRVYADDNSTSYNSSTDYYIHIRGYDNTVSNNYVERVGDLDHPGHGIGVKGEGSRNLFTDNTSVNISGGLYVRHRGVTNNLFQNNFVQGGVGILIRDGASANRFEKTRISDASWSIAYMDTKEDPGTPTAGFGNEIANSVIENSRYCAIAYSRFSTDFQETPAIDNRITHATIVNAPALFCGERPNSGNSISNSVVTGVAAFVGSDPYPIGDAIRHTSFWDTGFPTPEGDGNLQAQPMFVGAIEGNYRLATNSPLIDAGSAADTIGDDMDGVPRPQGSGPDLGAYEWTGANPTIPMPPRVLD